LHKERKKTKLHSQNDDNSIFTKEFTTERDQIALPTTSSHALENAQKKLSDRIGHRARAVLGMYSLAAQDTKNARRRRGRRRRVRRKGERKGKGG
jgi:hypothetical protein